MARNWTNDSGLALSAANLNALEADVTAALSVPDAALAARVQAGDTKTALDATYATKNNPAFTGTPTGLTKTHVGLGSVDNTADTAKPVSTAQQAALDLKLSTASAASTYAIINHTHPSISTNAATGSSTLTVGAQRLKPGVDARYSAFPSTTVLSDGRIFMVWYEATDHAATRDGIIRGSLSTDNGVTWGAAYTVLSSAGEDLRDPTVATDPSKTLVYLTYFKGSVANAAAGYFLRKGDANGANFGAEIRIDPSQPYAAGCAPIVTLSDNNLLATWYGKAVGTDAYDSVWIATSSNAGNTWSAATKVVDGVAASMDMQEPWAAVSGSTVVITHRRGNTADIGRVASANNGSTWGASATVFPGSGRPSTVITASGIMICAYRAPSVQVAAQHGFMRFSRDLGVTWSGPRMLEPATTGNWVYSDFRETAQGQILAVTSIEETTTSAVLSARYLTLGSGISPVGDLTPNTAARVLNRTSNIVATDDFHRPDATFSSTSRTDNGVLWSTQGSCTIKDSALDDRAATGPHLNWLRTMSTSHEVEADMMWTVSAGVALVCRLQDTSNYLMATIETGGVNARIYKVVAGTATQLATATVSCPADVWHKFRFSAIGNNLRFYIEDSLVTSVSDATFNNQGNAGLRIGVATASTVHRVRNFVARRRSEINV